MISLFTVAVRLSLRGSAGRWAIAALALFTLAGCSTSNSSQTAQQLSPGSPIPQATPIAQPPEARPIQPGSPQAAPPANTGQAPINSAATATTRDFTCDATYHIANISWQNQQPYLTFSRKPSTVFLSSAPATFSRGQDNSQTYQFQNENTTDVTFYTDGSCQLRVIGPNDTLTVQETGRSRPTAGTPAPPPTTIPPGGGGGVSSITCRGTIQNDISFIAYYTVAAGFYQVEFYPRAGSVVFASFASSGTNAQGQRIWRGAANAAADVVLTQLSTGGLQRGDRISVQYDGRAGTGQCGGLSALW